MSNPAPKRPTGEMFLLRGRRYLRRGAGGHGWSCRAVGLLGAGIVAVSSSAAARMTGPQRSAQAAASGAEMYAWGQNYYGQLGTGSTGASVETPRRVISLPADITAVAAGSSYSLALGSDGRVYDWGRNDYGQLGTGSTGGLVTTPRRVTGLPDDIKAVAAGGLHSLALGSDGRVYGWGYNTSGQAGTGSTASPVVTPVQVTGLPDDITAVAAGYIHSLALGSDGRVYGWGRNYEGQLGTGSTASPVVTPRQATGLPADIKAIAAGELHSLALASDGRVYAWGYNFYGQIGNGGYGSAGGVRTP